MERRDFVTSMLAGVSLLGAAGFSARAADDPHAGHKMPAAHFEKCAKACADCSVMCASCTAHCTGLLAEGKKEHLETLRSCQDCADFCATVATIVGRGGPYTLQACQACAEICAQCAKKCEAFPDQAHMKKCAEECRKCEAACREMIKHMA